VLDEKLVSDIDKAREIMATKGYSIVVVKNKKTLFTKTGEGVKPILETIEELGERMHDTVVGDRVLGKASALLCRYSKVKGVYSPQATKTAIALLIIGGIPCQVDKVIPFIQNKSRAGYCPFEKMLEDVDSSEMAYKILKENVLKKK